MREFDLVRRAAQRNALRALGVSPFEERLFASHIASAAHAGELHRLPVSAAEFQPLQDSDGNNYYLTDYSLIDGPDILS